MTYSVLSGTSSLYTTTTISLAQFNISMTTKCSQIVHMNVQMIMKTTTTEN